MQNARTVLRRGIEHGGVLIRDGRIVQVFQHADTPAGFSLAETIDLGGAYLAPGLIDIHVHGSAGIDFMETDDSGLDRLAEFLLSHGVTSCLATFVPAGDDAYRGALSLIDERIARQSNAKITGARILGIHFEGPFVSHQRAGALKANYFREYDGDERSIALFSSGRRRLNVTTVAPEINGGAKLIASLIGSGFRVFIGHSRAGLAELDGALAAGARHITHFPNALAPLHHREPGAIGWGLVRDEVTFDCIADLHHVHPLMLELMHRTKGADRMALISDAVAPAGLGDGEYEVWGLKISVRGGLSTLDQDGSAQTIAGSVVTLLQAVKNMAGLGVPVYEAISMASRVPASVVGIAGELGSIEVEKRADLIALNDDLQPELAICGGVVAFNSR